MGFWYWMLDVGCWDVGKSRFKCIVIVLPLASGALRAASAGFACELRGLALLPLE